MAIIACPECTNGVSHTAISCPHCGFLLKKQAPQPAPLPAAKPKNKNIGCGQIVAVLFILTCAMCTIGLITSDSSRSKTKTAKIKKTKVDTVKKKEVPAVEVSARTLFKDYQSNEVMADGKYKGKKLLVLGKIQKISKDFLDNTKVSLKTTNQFMPISATLKSGNDETAAKLKKGRKVRLKCTGGTMIIGNPQLEDCWIIEYW